jgi:hypothetical protein
MTMPTIFTVLAGAALSAAPTFVSFLPHELAGTLTAVFALATGVYHLFQPAPGSTVS